MASTRQLSVIGAVLLPGEQPELSTLRAQFANTSYSQARQLSDSAEVRRLYDQSQRSCADLQSEVQELQHKFFNCDKELKQEKIGHRQLAFEFNNLLTMSTNAETHLKKELEAADLQFARMQLQYKEQISDAEEVVKASVPHAAYDTLQKDFEFLKSKQEETLKKLADTQASHFDLKCSFVTSQYDLEVLQCEQKETLSSLAESQASNLSLKSALEASQVEVKGRLNEIYGLQYHLGRVLECSKIEVRDFTQEVEALTSELTRVRSQLSLAQNCGATPPRTAKMGSPSGAQAKTPSLIEIGSPATPSSSLAAFFDVPVSPLLTKPTPSAKEMLATPTPLPAYIKWEAAANVASPLGTSKLGGTPFDCSPYDAVAKTPTLSEIGSPASSLAAFFSAVPVSSPLTRPTPSAKEMLASPNPLPAYTKWEAGTSMVAPVSDLQAGRLHAQVCADNPCKIIIQRRPAAVNMEAPSAPTPAMDVQALWSPGINKPSPMGARPERPALTNITNVLTPKAELISGSPAGLQQALSMAQPSPLQIVKIGPLTAVKSSLPETAARKAALAALLAKGSSSASTTKSSCSSGFEASPGTPPGFDLNSPARGPFSRQRAVSSTVPSRACGSTSSSPSLLASSSRTKTASSSVMSPGFANRRASTTSSIGNRPAWRSPMSLSPVLPPSPAGATPPARLPSTTSQRGAVAQQPCPSPVSAGSARPAVHPSRIQAVRCTSTATAASQPATARPRASGRTGQVQASAAGGKAAQSTVEGPHRAGLQGISGATRPGPTRGAAAPTKAAKAAVVGVARQRGTYPVSSAPVRRAPDGGEAGQVRKGRGRSVTKVEAPTRVQPARRVKAPQHAWRS